MMKYAVTSAVLLFSVSAQAYPMMPRDLLFDPKTKEQFMALEKEDRVESLGYVLELTNRDKGLTTRQISKRAYKLEECVSKMMTDKRYAKKDAMTPISDCVAKLGFD